MNNPIEGFEPTERHNREGFSSTITGDIPTFDSDLDLSGVKISRRDFLKFAGAGIAGLMVANLPGSIVTAETEHRAHVIITTRPAIKAYFWNEIQPGENLTLAGVLPIEISLVKSGLMKVNWASTEITAEKNNLKNEWAVFGNEQRVEWKPQDDLVISGSFPFAFLSESSNPVTRTVGGDLFIHDTIHSVVATWAFKDING